MPIQVPSLGIIAPGTEEVRRVFHPEQHSGKERHEFAAQLEKERKGHVKGVSADEEDQEQRGRGAPNKRQPEEFPEKDRLPDENLIQEQPDLGRRVDIKI